MARFPYHKTSVKELGRLLAKAAVDENLKASFQKDPSTHLSKIGLPPQATELMTFIVVDQKVQPNAKSLPYRLNDEKLASGNAAYLKGLTRTFTLN